MLNTIRSFFNRPDRDPHFDDLPFERAKFAAAVLMVELARCDGDFAASENQAIRRMIQRRLELSADQAEGLVQLAEDEILSYWDDCWDNRPFRRRILEDCSLSERERIVEMLWEVVYADGTIAQINTTRDLQTPGFIIFNYNSTTDTQLLPELAKAITRPITTLAAGVAAFLLY